MNKRFNYDDINLTGLDASKENYIAPSKLPVKYDSIYKSRVRDEDIRPALSRLSKIVNGNDKGSFAQ